MYAWATPEYLLNHMSVEQVFFYYEKGLAFEEHRATILIGRLAEALGGKRVKQSASGDKPDREEFYKHYGQAIKRPEGGQGK